MIDERIVAHLESMRDAARKAVSLAESMSYDRFLDDPNAQAATAMFLIVVGEAAVKIMQTAPSFASSHDGLPWEQMRGLRNRIVHDYETLHVPTIWATARESLPALLSDLNKLLSDAPQTGT
jgi:uncharacterized protein with HEPN domain